MKRTDRLNKLKRMRTWANWSMGIGIAVMYLGYAVFAGYLGDALEGSYLFMTIMLVIGFLLMMFSTVLFMITGMVSTTVPQVECPACGKVTKMLGKEDACMFCGQPLLLDDGKEPRETEPTTPAP